MENGGYQWSELHYRVLEALDLCILGMGVVKNRRVYVFNAD